MENKYKGFDRLDELDYNIQYENDVYLYKNIELIDIDKEGSFDDDDLICGTNMQQYIEIYSIRSHRHVQMSTF